MDILFKNSQLEKTFNTFDRLVKKHGQKRAKLIIQRLSELRAMSDLSVARKLPHLGCHELKGDRRDELAVNLDHPYRLVFTVEQSPYPTKEDGGLDWSRVHTIQIERVEDYHGKRKKK